MNKISAFIQKLWTGRISPQEAHELNELLGSDEAGLREEMKKKFHATIGEPQTPEEYAEASEMYARLMAKIKITLHRRGNVYIMRKWIMVGAAAAMIAVACTTVLIYNRSLKPAPHPTASITIKNTSSSRSVANTSNDKMTVTLKDGSVVTLFANSAISYNDFNESVRSISLKGMAYFKVAKNPLKPFIVSSGGYTTTAIGTSFSVDNRKAGNVEVKLYEGKVVVMAINRNVHSSDVYLLPMQSFTVNVSTGKYAVNKFSGYKLPAPLKKDKNPATAPDDSQISFNNEALKNVFAILNEKWNARIIYNEKELKDLHFTGTLLKTDSIKTIVSIISKMNGLTAEEQGESIRIRSSR